MADTNGAGRGRIAADEKPVEQPRETASAIVDVEPGGTFDLRVAPLTKWIDGRPYEMLAYNGSIPGPVLRVMQGSQIAVEVTNDTGIDTTVHWHGLRLENRFDGVPHQTQAPIRPGGSYTHRLTFPDAGLYWYHPHIREDQAQELGLYGNVIVDPADASYWPAVDREIVLTLDDILIEDGAIAPFDPRGATFTAMGRYGNVLLIGGETHQRFVVAQGEVVRLCLTNTANTRVFKIALPDVRMKLVGADAGRYEREAWVDAVVVAPSERAIVDVRFDEPGAVPLQHLTPGRTYELGRFDVSGEAALSAAESFERLRVNAEMVGERERVAQYMLAPPDKILALVAEMDADETGGAMPGGEPGSRTAAAETPSTGACVLRTGAGRELVIRSAWPGRFTGACYRLSTRARGLPRRRGSAWQSRWPGSPQPRRPPAVPRPVPRTSTRPPHERRPGAACRPAAVRVDQIRPAGSTGSFEMLPASRGRSCIAPAAAVDCKAFPCPGTPRWRKRTTPRPLRPGRRGPSC